MKIKKGIVVVLIFIIVLIFVLLFIRYQNNKNEMNRQQYIEDIKSTYNKYVETIVNTNLYDKDKNIIGKINKGIKIELKNKEINNTDDDYFELELFDDCYVFFKDVKKIDKLDEKDDYYKKYIVFNENAVTKNKTIFYDTNFNYLYEIDRGISLPIYIKEDEYYGVEFNDELVYLKKDDVIIEEANNTDLKNAKSIPVLLYHFFHTHNKFEDMTTVISIRTDKFEQQLKYLTDNNFMTLKLKDLELYIKGKVQIKEDSVVITIDDGNASVYSLAYPIIEKYGVNATVFEITGWHENAINNQTDLVEIHSHTNNMHVTGKCSGGQGGLFKCIDYESGLADLKRARELLNGTTYLAYPFGEYTESSIQLLKDAGFTMAFTTNYGNAKVGNDPYLVPRMYVYNEFTLDTFKKMVN